MTFGRKVSFSRYVGRRYAQTSRDADAPSTPQPKDQVTLTMDVSFTLEDGQGKLVHEGKFSTEASHEFEISSEHMSGILKQEP